MTSTCSGAVWRFVAGAWVLGLSLSASAVGADPLLVASPPAHAIGFPSRNADLDALPGFRNPPPGYGEVGFYWWVGDPLTKERLAWQLDQLALVDGVMGLQINYAHSDRGGLSYGNTFPSDPPLFSPAWWDLVGWFMSQAKSRGMAVSLSDYTLGIGQGWKVDEILREHPDLQGSVLKADTREIDGGQEVVWVLQTNCLSVVAYRVEGSSAVTNVGVNLRNSIQDRTLKWSTPAGRWRMVAVHAERVIPSLDPMHPRSGPEYAGRFFGQFEDRFPAEGGKGLNFFFSDELEFRVQGRLWNARFAEEFKARKGYDIVPELPALFTDIGPRTPKVRLDFNDVQVALTEEGFFKPCFDWHQQRGMIFGCDHGGRGRNVMEFGDYFRTQRWNQGPGCDQPGLGSDIIKNKVASSIAHLYLRPRTWLEGYYGSGWGTSTEQLTDATLRNFVMGQNLLTLHGLYYTTHGGWWEWAPPCNHFRMPYWPLMRDFFAMEKRLSYLLSQGHHRCDVAVLYPVASMEAGLEGDASVRTAFALGEHLYQQGIDFDFMDFESLARAEVTASELRVSGERYRVLVLPAMQAVRWSTLQKAADFARAGGWVVALGAVPEASDRAGRDDPELKALVGNTFRTPAEVAIQRLPVAASRSVVESTSPSGGGVIAHRQEQVAELVSRAFPRDFDTAVTDSNGRKPLVMHRRVGPREVFAVYGAPQNSECSFRATGRVELWDPWTGATRPLSVREQNAVATTLRMPLEKTEMQLIVFSPGRSEVEGDSARPAPQPRVVPIEGPWEFELKPTLDNRFGDYRLPASSEVLGAEARWFRYADEAGSDPGWQGPSFDDSQWPKTTSSFGPQFWLLGPLPAAADPAALEATLAQLDLVDPSASVELEGKSYRWRPYSFSWRYGIENDPGHQGYHGLKEQMPDEFIGLGELQLSGTGTSYKQEQGGSRYYLWTSVAAASNAPAVALSGGLKPGAVWLNHSRATNGIENVSLLLGSNPLLLRYDAPGKGWFTVQARDAVRVAPSLGKPSANLTTRWPTTPGLLPFDTRPGPAHPAGWYRFVAPPGLRAMTIIARGKVQAWADGASVPVVSGRERVDGARELRAALPQVAVRPVVVALRIEQERGAYAGAALPEPIRLDCAPGEIELGDWSGNDGLSNYSGGAWYRKRVDLPRSGKVTLDLGKVASSAEIHVNGVRVGTRLAPPWRLDISKWTKVGENQIEVLVYSALANHYGTIPTRYRGSPVSGLLGPVTLLVENAE